MLHQKQLQSVLHHGNNANSYGAGHSSGYSGTSWHPEGVGHSDSGFGAQSYSQQVETPGQPPRDPAAPQQVHTQPPPPPPQTNEPQPGPPPPEPPSVKPPDNNLAPKEDKKHTPTTDDKSLPLQDKQQLWYKQHLQNLQKLKNERAKQNQKDGNGPMLPTPEQAVPPPPPSESKGLPPPPPPKEEPPAPPPPPQEPDVPQDPDEAARLNQLQAAAAQWQQVQQQRASVQYQALMTQHEKLQHVLEKYQQLLQQPANIQSMTTEMQLRHYEMQQQQFTPLFRDWNHSFLLWHEQFQTYHHKDQLQDYANQWKQWQEQMTATSAHLQERVATLTTMVPFASSQYSSGMMGQYGQFPEQNMQIQQHSVTPGMEHSPGAVGPGSQGLRPTGFVPNSESPAGPPIRGGGPASLVRPPGPATIQPPGFNSIRGPRPTGPSGNNPRFDQPQQAFDGHPRFGPPQQGFDGPPKFDQSQQRFDGPPRFDQPPPRFDGPPRFNPPQQRFDGPPRFDQPPPRFDAPPQFDQPRHRFDGPPRFDHPRQRFDGPPRFDKPRFGQQPRFEQTPRHPAAPPRFERPPVPLQVQQQAPQPKAEQATKPTASMDAKTPGKSVVQPQSEKEKSESPPEKKIKSEDLTDDNLLGSEGFFVQDDPIPQTLQTNTNTDETDGSNASDNSEKPKPVNSKPSVTSPTTGGSMNTAAQNQVKPDGPPKGKIPPLVPKTPGIQLDPQASGQMQSRPDPPRPPLGRGRGQPPVPVQAHGRGRGQMGSGEFRGPNTVPLGGTIEEDGSFDYMPTEGDLGMQEEEEEYYWQDPYEEYGGGESEVPPEEMWVPEEQYFLTEEEYYEEHWEDPESVEYSEEGDPYWEERRPPMRGMRPLFPPGRGRPPRGHPDFMHQGRGRPPHQAHGPMDHEALGYEMDTDDTEMDPSGHPMYHENDPHSHSMHPDVGRGRRHMPLPPHEMMDPTEEEPLYDEEMERESGWQTPHGRGPPLPPHEMMDSGGMRRRPMGRGMGRDMWRPGQMHEKYEEGFKEGIVEDYGHGEGGYRWRPPQDYPPDDYRHEAKHYESEWDRERPPPERDYPPRMPPSEPHRDGHWPEERERGPPYPFDERDRGRGELRIREYGDEPPYRQEEPPYPPPPSERDRPPRLPPPPERGYPADYEDRRARYEDHREEPPLDKPSGAPVTESSVEGMTGANVLALSQHQHEIILKAAQELKLIRELKEGKTPGTEPQPPTDVLPDLPAGLLGLEIPPDVRNVLKGMTAAAKIVSNESQPLSSAPTPTVIPKTVDYGHGHGISTTVEQMSYGERIVLRPDPVPSNRGYEKGEFHRDPYYDRRSDPYMDRRDYSRERELYREKLPPEYDRERFERQRYPPRERDERSPQAPPLRSGYRERDRDLREKDQSGSRDRDEHYGRPGYNRPPYERTGLDRSGSERYGHSSSPYADRRSFPEDRGPPSAPPLPPPPQPPPRVEKKPEIKNIDDLLKPPGRSSRPERIVIIMRGLPGSGKSHVAKLIRDKEVDCGGTPPRVLVLDDYYMTEVEKVEKDPDTGRRVKTKVLEYEYEPEMEDTYRSSMLKTFKKTLDDGFFPFIILDTINDRVKHFDQFWSAAKTKGFEVYLAEITADTQTCAKRNVHGRTLKDISKMSNNWESSPRHMVRLDVRSLLQDAAIEEVEMEDFNPDDEPKEPKAEEEEEGDRGYIPKSKWEMDTSEAKLDKLDGLRGSGKRKHGDMAGLDDYLQLPDDYATRTSEPGKKRVRWADLEEQKDADRKRAIGFVVGQTDWERITDESGQLAQRALNRTKYF
uniref:YLP motif-containing protein 1 n=1 Tax=Sparus aurata TaxID=8175 RepID=A0A671V2U8_SPAAU